MKFGKMLNQQITNIFAI